MERSEALSRKVDLERLKNMRNKGSAAPAAPVSAKTAVKKVDTKVNSTKSSISLYA